MKHQKLWIMAAVVLSVFAGSFLGDFFTPRAESQTVCVPIAEGRVTGGATKRIVTGFMGANASCSNPTAPWGSASCVVTGSSSATVTCTGGETLRVVAYGQDTIYPNANFTETRVTSWTSYLCIVDD